MGKRPCQTPAWLIAIISDSRLSKNKVTFEFSYEMYSVSKQCQSLQAMPWSCDTHGENSSKQGVKQLRLTSVSLCTCFCKSSCSLQNVTQTPDLISCLVFSAKWHFTLVLMRGYEPVAFCGLPEELSLFTPFSSFLSALSYSRILGSKSTLISSVWSPGQKKMSRDLA